MADDEDAQPVRREVSKRPRPLRAERLIEDELRASMDPPSPIAPTPSDGERPSDVVVEFDGPVPQRRATVAFRIILAIPHFLYATLLNVVALFAVVATWFGALFLGRAPDGLATFLGRIIQYNARVYAYGGLLLTDRFPRFALDEPDGAVNVRFSPGPLNRFAVFFRFILMVPAAIVSQLVTSGYFLACFVVWLIVLIKGRLPAALFQAEAAMLRYATRYWSYVAMLTSEYPRGLFGDKDTVSPVAVNDGDNDVPPALPAQPKVTRLVLTKGAKRLVVLFIVLGVISQIGSNAFTGGDSGTRDALEEAYDDLEAERAEFAVSTQGCGVSGGLDCLHAADNVLAEAFEDFRSELRSNRYNDAALAVAEDMDDLSGEIVDLLHRMAGITDRGQYGAAASELLRLTSLFDEQYNELDSLLFF